jgi:hypothetical protein
MAQPDPVHPDLLLWTDAPLSVYYAPWDGLRYLPMASYAPCASWALRLHPRRERLGHNASQPAGMRCGSVVVLVLVGVAEFRPMHVDDDVDQLDRPVDGGELARTTTPYTSRESNHRSR